MNLDISIIISIITFIFGILSSYLFQKFPITNKKIVYKKETSCLISDETIQLDGLSVTQNNSPINNLYLTKITIVNKKCI